MNIHRVSPTGVDFLPEPSVREPAVPVAQIPRRGRVPQRAILVGSACAAAIAVAVFVVRRTSRDREAAPSEDGALGAVVKGVLFSVLGIALKLGVERILAEGIRRAGGGVGERSASAPLVLDPV